MPPFGTIKDNGGEKEPGIISNKLAHDYKMTVMLKPHLWVNHGFTPAIWTLKLMLNGMGSRL
jgi:hypothetical protein